MALHETAERLKYERYWAHELGRAYSPGEEAARDFVREFDGITVLDAGCGTGRAALYMLDRELDVTLVDIAENALDAAVRSATHGLFVRAPLWELPFPNDWFGAVFCCDVLEHLPTDMVEPTLAELARVAPLAYCEWADVPDGTGPRTVGEHVHLTLKPLDWWCQRFGEHYARIKMGTRGNTHARRNGHEHRERRVSGGWAWLER